jgi:hypothetical protein
MLRSVDADIKVVDDFLQKAAVAVEKLGILRNKLKNDPQFRAMYEADFMAALESIGIDPNAQSEMGFPRLQKDSAPARFTNCITPQGNLCTTCPD